MIFGQGQVILGQGQIIEVGGIIFILVYKCKICDWYVDFIKINVCIRFIRFFFFNIVVKYRQNMSIVWYIFRNVNNSF